VTTTSGSVLSADYLVVAAGAQANFFGTPGAAEQSLPLYSVNGAESLGARILNVLDATQERPELIEGSLNFVIVGGGPTGVETAGTLAEVLRDVVPKRYRSLTEPAKVHLVDHGDVLLAPFSDKAHAYAANRLERDGVQLHLGVVVKEVLQDRVLLSDGTTIMTQTVVWGGGEKPVHAALLSGTRNKIDAFIAWGWDYFSNDRAIAIVDRTDDARIDWGDDDQGERPEFDSPPASFTPAG
jgi:NADH dehydrogenase